LHRTVLAIKKLQQNEIYMNSEAKGSKRDKPEHDSSLEEERQIFKSSKLVARSPIKSQESEEKDNMEQVKKMIADLRLEWKKDMEKIRADIRDVKGVIDSIEDMRREINQNNAEVKSIREEVNRRGEEWAREREEIKERLRKTEERVEKIERDKIRNNLLVSGIEIDADDDETVKKALEKMIEEELNVRVKAKKAYKIGPSKCILEMNEWTDKVKILKEKGRLRGKHMFIDSELTLKEREIQKKIRDVAREERKKGIRVKVRYQRLEMDGKTLEWDNKEQRLKDSGRVSGNPKN